MRGSARIRNHCVFGSPYQMTIIDNPVGAGEYTENGHLLAPRVGNPGVYCKKCGKFVARMKHIRLKITSQPCAHKDAPPERWASGEGWSQAFARLDASMTCTTNITKGDIRFRGTGEWEKSQGRTMGAHHMCAVLSAVAMERSSIQFATNYLQWSSV